MKRNKIVAWLLCVVMMIGIMAGCGGGNTKETEKPKETGNAVESEKLEETEKTEETEETGNFNEEGYPIVNEEITLKVMLGVRDSDTIVDPEEMPALQRLEELTGINVEWEIVKQADWSTKLNLMWASEEYPDVIIASNMSVDVEEYGVTQGLLIPLDELSEKYMPIYHERIDMEASDPTVSLRASDGKKYTIGKAMHYGNQLNQNYFINQEWLKALNLEMPTDVESLTEVLRAFVTKDPNGNGVQDEIGVEMRIDGFYGVRFMLPLFDVPCDSSLWIYIDENKQVQSTPNQEGFRECMEWLHTLYKGGVLDPEIFSHNQATVESKLKTNSVGFFTAWRLGNMGFDEGVAKDSVLWIPEEATMHRILNLATSSAYVTKTNENVEATMRWMDAMLDDEMMFSLLYGEEGATDGTGWKRLENGKITINNMTATEKTFLDVNTIYWVPSNYYNSAYDAPPAYAEKKEISDIYEENGLLQTYSNDYLDIAPLTSDQKAELTLIKTDLNKAVLESIPAFIQNGVTDQSWNDFLKTLEDIGISDYVKTYQEAFDKIGIE